MLNIIKGLMSGKCVEKNPQNVEYFLISRKVNPNGFGVFKNY